MRPLEHQERDPGESYQPEIFSLAVVEAVQPNTLSLVCHGAANALQVNKTYFEVKGGLYRKVVDASRPLDAPILHKLRSSR